MGVVRLPGRGATMVAVLGCVVLALLVVAVRPRSPSDPSASAAALGPYAAALREVPGVQGPAQVAAVVTAPNGARVVCPLGSEPRVTIDNAYFEPSLAGGSDFLPGRYRVRLDARVVNESSRAITVTSLTPMLGRVIWKGARLSGPTALAANAGGPLTITGTIVVTRRQQAALSASLTWAWADSRLAPCGGRGLVDDD